MKQGKATCEVCRTLNEVVDALDPDRFSYGAEKTVGEALRTALKKHRKREHE